MPTTLLPLTLASCCIWSTTPFGLPPTPLTKTVRPFDSPFCGLMVGMSWSEVLAGLKNWPLAPRYMPSYDLGDLPAGSGTAAARAVAAVGALEALGFVAGVETARAAGESMCMDMGEPEP